MRKRRSKLALTPKQADMLWGEEGPYSEAKLYFNSRILDDKISRVFIEVEASINPLTFELLLEHRDEFIGDEEVQQLLDHSDNRGLKFGYVSCAFSQEQTSAEDIELANLQLKRVERLIIRLHRWVMHYLDTDVN
jgi:hypothetical protein